MKGRYISAAAAVICAVTAAVSVMGLRSADIGMPGSADFSPKPQLAAADVSLSKEGSAAEDLAADGGDGQSDDSLTDNNSSGEDAEDTAPSPGLSRTSGDNDNAPDGGESQKDNSDSRGERRASPSAPASPDNDLPGSDPQDGDETDEQLFTTSIRDGEHVANPEYSFTITHLNKSYKLKTLTVKVNGRRVPWSGTVTLSAGENTIRIYAEYTDPEGLIRSGFREYTVWLDGSGSRPDSKPDKRDSAPDDSSSQDDQPESREPRLVTDLSDMTTSAAELSFTAYIDGGDSSELKVYLGGSRLDPDNNEYRCELAMGLNTIRLKGAAKWNGEDYAFEQSFTVKRIAETTPETVPRLSYHNVPEEVRGDTYTLDLVAEDFSGGRIYDNGITVLLNGREIKCSWVGEYTSYLLRLTAGENTLDIRVTDGDGRYADYSFVITCSSAADGEVIGVCTLKLDANVLGLGELMPQTELEIRQGESAVDAIVRTLEQSGFTVGLKGSYIERIYRDGIAAGAEIPEPLRQELEEDGGIRFTDEHSPDSLGERDFTSLSGWMIAVNGHYISYGAGDLHLKDGDILQLRFTLAAGRDIGDAGAGECYENIY